jgi:hypothetical protein
MNTASDYFIIFWSFVVGNFGVDFIQICFFILFFFLKKKKMNKKIVTG